MGSELQIQDLFDLAFGTSVGKLHIPILQDVRLKIEIGSHCLYLISTWHTSF